MRVVASIALRMYTAMVMMMMIYYGNGDDGDEHQYHCCAVIPSLIFARVSMMPAAGTRKSC